MRLGIHPVDVDFRVVEETGVGQRLGNAHVGVVQIDVLADQRDLRVARRGDLIRSTSQRHSVEIGRLAGEAEAAGRCIRRGPNSSRISGTS